MAEPALIGIMWGSNIFIFLRFWFIFYQMIQCHIPEGTDLCVHLGFYSCASLVGARSPYCVWPLLVWCHAGGYRLGGSGWHCILYTCCHTCHGICGFSACCWVRLVLDLINASDVQWKLWYLALDDAGSSFNQKCQLYVNIPSTGSTMHQFQDFGD